MRIVAMFSIRYCRIPTRSAHLALSALGLFGLCASALAAEKPPLAPDTLAPFSTDSQISASVEFSLPVLAREIEKDVPRRLATIDERVSCVHKRVLFARINANCDIYGYVERSGPVSLYGRGDRVYGAVPIYGALEGQGANRFTSRIHGETEASAVVEAEARPELTPDWALQLNFSDGFHWSEAPVLHVLGREIPVSKYAEPRVRAQLAVIREKALAAARKLNLRDKAETAWRKAFEPIELSETPQVWLQLNPQSLAFAGVRADAKVLRGSLQLSGSAETAVGQQPAAVTATAMPPLGHDVGAPGAFDAILPLRIGYDVIKDKITQAVTVLAPAAGLSVSDVEVYPSSGKLVIGLHLAKSSDTDVGKSIYLTGSLQADAPNHRIRLADLSVSADDNALASLIDPLLGQLGDNMSIDYGPVSDQMLSSANAKLNRPLQDGFRMEAHLASAQPEKVYYAADAVVVAVRVTGDLKILYGM
jgi:hypothetical protein